MTVDVYEIEDILDKLSAGKPDRAVRHALYNTTLNLKTFNYPLTTSNAFDHICRQQTYGFA